MRARKEFILFQRRTRGEEDYFKRRKADAKEVSAATGRDFSDVWRESKAKDKRLKKKSGTFYVQFWDAAKGRYSTARSTGQTSKTAAENYVAQQLRTGAYRQHFASRDTVATHAQNFWDDGSEYIKFVENQRAGRITRKHREETARRVKKYLVPFLKHWEKANGELRLNNLTAGVLGEMRAWLGDNFELSPATENRIFSALRTMCSYWRQKGLMTLNPFDAFTLRRENSKRVAYSIAQVVTIFHPKNTAILWADIPAVYYRFSLVAAATGARFSEVAGLKVEDFDGAALYFRRVWDGKKIREGMKAHASERVNFVSKYVADVISEAVAESGCELIFPEPDVNPPRPVREEYHGRAWRLVQERAGIKPPPGKELSFHSLRHTLETETRARGLDSLILKYYTGRSLGAEGSVSGYVHFDSKDAQNGVVAYQDALFSPDTSRLAVHAETNLLTVGS